MKRLFLLICSAMMVCACYEDYVVDYNYSGIFIANQYDLRSFIVGEGMQFKISSALGGVKQNTRDREVQYVIDNSLVTGDLSGYCGTDEPFTAFDVMSVDNSSFGKVSQPYVTAAVKQAVSEGLTGLTPLPAGYYSLSSDVMTIKAGNHNAFVTVQADSSKLLLNGHFTNKPYYAIGYKIIAADADSVIRNKSFGIVALRYECRFFGNWYRSGISRKVDASGKIISEDVHPIQIPCDDNSPQLYVLTTSGPYSVNANYIDSTAGIMTITILSDGTSVVVSDGESKIQDLGSSWNNNILLQDRRIFLNYEYPNEDGTKTIVKDTLSFRNRINDGVNEWQDPDPTHYK